MESSLPYDEEMEPGVDPSLESAIGTFFMTPFTPISTHEEWLLRMCHSLMEREASVVSFMEAQARSNVPVYKCEENPPPERRRSRRGKCRPRHKEASHASSES